jgi:hypothetical protein
MTIFRFSPFVKAASLSHRLLMACALAILISAFIAQRAILPIATVACIAGTINMASHVVIGLASGTFPWGKGSYPKGEKPTVFWILVLVCSLGCAGYLVAEFLILGNLQ